MKRSLFIRRTGKALATSRAILALVFLLALWIDPVQPARSLTAGFAVLTVYLAWSILLVAIAWRSWWLDFRLSAIVHGIDILAFIGAVYITETGRGDFSSPFMAFVVFLLIFSAMRWGWAAVLRTAVALVVANSLAGVLLTTLHLDIDIYRFGRRQSYMVVLSIIMVWLGVERRRPLLPPLPEPGGIPGERRDRVLANALSHVRTSLQARGAALAVVRDEEPWLDVVKDIDGTITTDRIGPNEIAEDISHVSDPMLFNRPSGRGIVLGDDGAMRARMERMELPLATYCGVDEGLLASFVTADGHGQLLVWGASDLGVDDLSPVRTLAREIGLAIDREDMAALAQSAAVSDIRQSLARDLHDSVAQFLAGTLFRLEALRRWIREGNDPSHEIDGMKEALRREQAQLRVMIDRLRRGEEGDRKTDLVEELESLLGEIGHHWHITTRLVAEERPLSVSIHLAYELRQVVREAVANAVRHGHCRTVEVQLAMEEAGALRILISDDGEGFPKTTGVMRPRSISERIETLGGRIAVSNSDPGAVLDIDLPIRIAA
ncbi:sensor histidine kinase [Novosphingobium cyanobacteriorum]|uniref:histidine kinase n=1 Tax=Novosphingobium cyanobacteriorum TaxID=3024215 RepID=A0ABT6CMR1_9SPHN|nr:histidine kinase [Novosphingobium cyanobacteriorum]MDF8335204.1 histidine kinase [Novosphingobium cyanobacteriorum]